MVEAFSFRLTAMPSYVCESIEHAEHVILIEDARQPVFANIEFADASF